MSPEIKVYLLNDHFSKEQKYYFSQCEKYHSGDMYNDINKIHISKWLLSILVIQNIYDIRVEEVFEYDNNIDVRGLLGNKDKREEFYKSYYGKLVPYLSSSKFNEWESRKNIFLSSLDIREKFFCIVAYNFLVDKGYIDDVWYTDMSKFYLLSEDEKIKILKVMPEIEEEFYDDFKNNEKNWLHYSKLFSVSFEYIFMDIIKMNSLLSSSSKRNLGEYLSFTVIQNYKLLFYNEMLESYLEIIIEKVRSKTLGKNELRLLNEDLLLKMWDGDFFSFNYYSNVLKLFFVLSSMIEGKNFEYFDRDYESLSSDHIDIFLNYIRNDINYIVLLRLLVLGCIIPEDIDKIIKFISEIGIENILQGMKMNNGFKKLILRYSENEHIKKDVKKLYLKGIL